MFRFPPAVLALPLAFLAGPATRAAIGVSGDDCEVVTITKDGREVRTEQNAHASAGRSSGEASSASVRSGSGSARSSVSVSSSSGGGSRSSAVSSTTDANGRTVTTRRDENGCTITVDERDA